MSKTVGECSGNIGYFVLQNWTEMFKQKLSRNPEVWQRAPTWKRRQSGFERSLLSIGFRLSWNELKWLRSVCDPLPGNYFKPHNVGTEIIAVICYKNIKENGVYVKGNLSYFVISQRRRQEPGTYDNIVLVPTTQLSEVIFVASKLIVVSAKVLWTSGRSKRFPHLGKCQFLHN